MPATAEEPCIEPPFEDATSPAQNELLELRGKLLAALEEFPSLLKTLDDRAPDLCFLNTTHDAYGYLDVSENRIYVARSLASAMQLGILLHEVRHLDQLQLGACASDDLAMAEYARAVFALEADASAVSLLIAWSMKDRGDPSVWQSLSSSEPQSDIATRFATEMDDSGDVGMALSAAFDQWYEREDRRSRYYLSTCSAYLDRQDQSKAIPRYQLLPDSFFRDLCRMPDGREYACSEPDDAPLR